METSPEASPAPPPRATSASERIVAMDVLRGFALFGVLFVNLPSFAMTSDVAYVPPGPGGADQAAWAALVGLGMMKFVALFSLLFGMGLVLQMQRAEARGGDPRAFRALYLRRLALLGAFGLLHGVFLFVGDILFVYSIAGLVLFACRRFSPTRLLTVAAALFAVGVLLSSVVLTAPSEASAGNVEVPSWAPGENVSLADLDTYGDESAWPAFERKAYSEGPLASTILVNAAGYVGWLLISSIISFNWRVLALFFAGAALMKLDLFDERRKAWHARMIQIGGLGLVLEIAHAALAFRAGSADSPSVLAVILNELGATMLAAGYVGGVATLVRRGTWPGLQGGLAAVGRTALTNYILQSVLANVLFRWWGFDLYAQLSYGALALITAGVFGLQIVLSRLWLSRFASGPLEALWRKWTYR